MDAEHYNVSPSRHMQQGEVKEKCTVDKEKQFLI